MEMIDMNPDFEKGRQLRETLVRNTNRVQDLAKEVQKLLKWGNQLYSVNTNGDEYQKCIRFYNKLLSDATFTDLNEERLKKLKECFKNTNNDAAWVIVAGIRKRELNYKSMISQKGTCTVDKDTFNDACEAAKMGDASTLREFIENTQSKEENRYLLTEIVGSTSKKNILQLAVLQKCHASLIPNQLECINLILHYARKLQMKDAVLDHIDHDGKGKTALQIAIENKSEEICKELLSHGAKLCLLVQNPTTDNTDNRSPNELLEMLYENVPGAVAFLFDRNVVIKQDQSTECMTHSDYTNIIGFAQTTQNINNQSRGDAEIEMQEMQPLNSTSEGTERLNEDGLKTDPNMDVTFLATVTYNQTECSGNIILRHSLVEDFVQAKLKSKKKYLKAYFVVQVILYLLYMFLMGDIYWDKCPQSTVNTTDCNTSNVILESDIECTFSAFEYILIPILYIFALIMSVLEVFEFLNLAKLKTPKKWNPYIYEKENYFQIIFILLSFCTTLPILCQQTVFYNFQYFFASIGVFFCAVSFLCAIGNGNFDLSEYIIVYGKIVKRLAFVLLTFSILIAAFVISFFITFPDMSTFYITKTFMMLSGEFNFDDDFRDFKPPSGTFNSVFGQVQYVMFALSVTIVFVNIFLGYTIGDIEEFSAVADVYRRKIQIKQLFILDEMDRTFNQLTHKD